MNSQSDSQIQPSTETEQLSQLLLFKEADLKNIKQWTDQCPHISFNKGDIMLTPENVNEFMYVILKGTASIRLGDIDNNPVAHAEPGESVGEMSVFSGDSQPSAYVKAETDIETLAINHEILLELVEHSHAVARNLLFLLSKRLKSGNVAVTNSQYLQKEFEQHANVDALTGLYNRRWINNYFDRLMARMEHQNSTPDISILLIDIDHFKQFNDTHGHLAGDQALRCVASALKESVRPTDLVSRYGGEEFLVILPETAIEHAHTVAERIREGVKQHKIQMGEVTFPELSVSTGISTLQGDDTFSSLIEAADQGLYQAKRNGRDCVICARQHTD